VAKRLCDDLGRNAASIPHCPCRSLPLAALATSSERSTVLNTRRKVRNTGACASAVKCHATVLENERLVPEIRRVPRMRSTQPFVARPPTTSCSTRRHRRPSVNGRSRAADAAALRDCRLRGRPVIEPWTSTRPTARTSSAMARRAENLRWRSAILNVVRLHRVGARAPRACAPTSDASGPAPGPPGSDCRRARRASAAPRGCSSPE
jgi:hypothetical protein